MRARPAPALVRLVLILLFAWGVGPVTPQPLLAQAKGGGGGGSGCVSSCCPTFMRISSAIPTSTYSRDTLTVTAQFGIDYSDFCQNDTFMPDTSSFEFTVNGIDRTSYFHGFQQESDGTSTYWSVTGVAVPLVDQATDDLVASSDGIDTLGNSRVDEATASVAVDARPTAVLSASFFTPGAYLTGGAGANMTACTASCFTAAYSQGTVPYFSLGSARNVTLVYRDDRLAPKPILHVDVAPDLSAQYRPSEYWLELKRSDGYSIHFVNGETKLRFSADTASVRLAAQFDTAELGGAVTTVVPLSLTVTSVYDTLADTVAKPSTTTVNLLYINDADSKIAKGWTVAGLQTLHRQGNGSALIVDGSGDAAFFSRGCDTCAFQAMPGDYSRLVYSSADSLYTRTYPDSSVVIFDFFGRMITAADRFGDSTQYVYDAAGRLIHITDPYRTYSSGGQLPHAYIELNYATYGLSSIVEPAPGTDATPGGGRTTTLSVAPDRTLSWIRDPDNVSTSFSYTADGRLSTVTDRRGGVTRFDYDSLTGMLAAVEAPAVVLDGQTTASSPVTHFSAWQPVSVPYAPTVSQPLVPAKTSAVSASVTDPGGHQTTFDVDADGMPMTTVDPAGRTTRSAWSHTRLISTTAPSGAVRTYAYTNGNISASTATGVSDTHTDYGNWSLPTRVYGPNRPEEDYYSSGGKVDSVKLAGTSIVTRYTYTSSGRVLTVTDPLGHVTSYHYDPIFGNADSTRDPNGAVRVISFDGYGRNSAERSTGMAWNRTVYDQLNRPVQIYDGVDANPETLTYDGLYLYRVTDPKGQVFRSDVNALGWTTRRYDPADTVNRFVAYTYTADGLVASSVNRRGDTLRYAYDGAHRVTSKSGHNTTTDAFRYAANDLWAVSSNANAVDSVTFDVTGRQASLVTTFPNGQSFTIVHYADTLGRPDSTDIRTTTNSIAFVASKYLYDSATGFPKTLRLRGTDSNGAVFNADGLITVKTLAGGAPDDSALYTTHHDLYQSHFSQVGVDSLMWRGYGRDPLGRLAHYYYKSINGTKMAGNNFVFDSLGRYTTDEFLPWFDDSACTTSLDSGYSCSSGINSTEYAAYDAAGNDTSAGRQYATGNRLQGSGGSVTLTYDNDGNLASHVIGSVTKTFGWSAENRLTSVTVGARQVSYAYDASGRLVLRSVNGQPDRYFVWDGDQLLAELDGQAQHRIAEYIYPPAGSTPFAIATGATTISAIRYFVSDAMGDVAGIISGGAVVDSYHYGPWGDLATASTATAMADTNRLRWKAAFWEGDSTQMYYMVNRWYDPELRRFISEDPAGISAGLNLYTFADDDPINGIDPTGEWALHWGIRWRRPWHDILHYGGPAVAFAAIVVVGSFTIGPMASAYGAMHALAGAAAGSAAAAAVESAVTGRPFESTFMRDFNLSSWFLASMALLDAPISGGIASVGNNGGFQGYIQTKAGCWSPLAWLCSAGGAITGGSAAAYQGASKDLALDALYRDATHEFGHTIELSLLSMFGNPWYAYSALGGAGMLGERGFGGYLGDVGCGWEELASFLGHSALPCR